MDATPLTLGQEFSGYAAQVDHGDGGVRAPCRRCTSWPSAAPPWARASTVPDYAECAAEIAALTGLPFVTAPNKFAGLAAHDALVSLSRRAQDARRGFNKIANDLRWLGSGPRCGIGELCPPRERARQLDHARQGQPRPSARP
jgi:fumarate hydratase class II